MDNSEEREELDPEIAELLQLDEEESEDFEAASLDIEGKPIKSVEIKQINLEKVIENKNHYIDIISNTGEAGKRFHDILSKFSKAVDRDEKSMYREKLIPAYWNMLTSLVDILFDKPKDQFKVLFRYGLLNPSFLEPSQIELLKQIHNNSGDDPDIFFVDEWLMMVGSGRIKQSAIDETKLLKKSAPSVIKSKLERKKGSLEAEYTSLKSKIEQHLLLEKSLKSSVNIITNHLPVPGREDLITPYTEDQKKALTQLLDIVRSLQKSNKEIETIYRTIEHLKEEINSLENSGVDLSEQIDTKVVREEFSTVRQMIKMTVGRQGNHFPFLLRTYMPKSPRDLCSKNNLKILLDEIERIDPGVFVRRYKKEDHRIFPYFLIVPSYGDFGICWEPFDRMNKATGKGRIALPMYPKNLKIAILYALGDMRWQLAKEKALHYWMEEGLTGHYYDYFQSNKLKGDLKESFIQDYIQWIIFESQGMQKLHKDVRAIFWRYIPFPQTLKDQLKTRGYYYAELYKKDQNRAISRGY